MNDWLCYLLENGINYTSTKWMGYSRPEEPVNPYITTGEWVTGGITGGDCWGGEANRPIGSVPEPEFTQLDNLLEVVWPDITHLKYKKLVSELVTEHEHGSNEYYGNNTRYSEKRIDLGDLYEWLRANGRINS